MGMTTSQKKKEAFRIKRTYVSNAEKISNHEVRVRYQFLQKSGSVVIGFESSNFYCTEEMMARSELMVMRNVMAYGVAQPNKFIYTTSQHIEPYTVQLSSHMATMAIRKAVYQDYSILRGAEMFAYVFCQTSDIASPDDDLNITMKPDFTKFNKMAYNKDGCAIVNSPLLGVIRINSHAYEKLLKQSVFAVNNYAKDKAFRFMLTDLVGDTSLTEVSLVGKVKEDKKFYAKTARYFGSKKRHIRYTVVPYLDNDDNFCYQLVTVYTRPDKVGSDPYEKVICNAINIKKMIDKIKNGNLENRKAALRSMVAPSHAA